MLSFHLLPNQFLALLLQLKRGHSCPVVRLPIPHCFKIATPHVIFEAEIWLNNPYQIYHHQALDTNKGDTMSIWFYMHAKITYHPQPAMKTSRPPNLGHAMGHVVPCQDQLPRPRPEDLAKIRHPTNSGAGAWARPLPVQQSIV